MIWLDHRLITVDRRVVERGRRLVTLNRPVIDRNRRLAACDIREVRKVGYHLPQRRSAAPRMGESEVRYLVSAMLLVAGGIHLLPIGGAAHAYARGADGSGASAP